MTIDLVVHDDDQPTFIVTREDWMQQAACRNAHPDLFFPTRGVVVTDAIAVCNTCTVKDECLKYALDNCEMFGIWGGTSERQRRLMRREARGGRRTLVAVALCGTRSGYNRHRRAGEDACPDCKHAMTEYNKANRAAKVADGVEGAA